MLTLAIDQGTTSTRAILFDSDYKTHAKSQHPVRLASPRCGWAEQDADEIIASVRKCIADVGGLDGSRIKAIGLTNQRESTVAWSRSTGAALCPVIAWMDTRTSSMLSSYELPLVRELTGLPMSTYFSALKMRWMLDNCEQVKQRAEEGDLVFGTVDSWVLFHLADQQPGGGLFVTDPTNASRTMLMNLTTKQWDDRLLRHFDIKREWLCEITKGSFGSINGIPVKAVLGDQHAALYGHGGKTKCTYGTGCFVVTDVGSEPIRRSSLVSTLAYGDHFALEAPIASAGSAVDWLTRLLGVADARALCDLALEGSEEVHFIPALTGLLAPVWNAEARGSFHNLSLSTTPADLARSALHSIAFSVALVLEEMSPSKDDYLVVDGGLSVSDLLMQIQADVLNRPVHRPKNVEFTALGVAMYANSDTTPRLTINNDIFAPKKDLSIAFAAWKRLFLIACAYTNKAA